MYARRLQVTGIVWVERLVMVIMLALVLHWGSAAFRSLSSDLLTSIAALWSLRFTWLLANAAVVAVLAWMYCRPVTGR